MHYVTPLQRRLLLRGIIKFLSFDLLLRLLNLLFSRRLWLGRGGHLLGARLTHIRWITRLRLILRASIIFDFRTHFSVYIRLERLTCKRGRGRLKRIITSKYWSLFRVISPTGRASPIFGESFGRSPLFRIIGIIIIIADLRSERYCRYYVTPSLNPRQDRHFQMDFLPGGIAIHPNN